MSYAVTGVRAGTGPAPTLSCQCASLLLESLEFLLSKEFRREGVFLFGVATPSLLDSLALIIQANEVLQDLVSLSFSLNPSAT